MIKKNLLLILTCLSIQIISAANKNSKAHEAMMIAGGVCYAAGALPNGCSPCCVAAGNFCCNKASLKDKDLDEPAKLMNASFSVIVGCLPNLLGFPYSPGSAAAQCCISAWCIPYIISGNEALRTKRKK